MDFSSVALQLSICFSQSLTCLSLSMPLNKEQLHMIVYTGSWRQEKATPGIDSV
jgi:hypothetical protein